MKKIYIPIIITLVAVYSSGVSCYQYKEYNINKFCSNGYRYKTIELDNDEDDSAIILKSGNNYRNYLDCALYVEADKGYGIIVSVRKVNLRKVVDNLEIEINKNLKPEWTGSRVNGNKEIVAYVADRKVKVEFSTGYSSESTKYREFELVLTAFRISNKCDRNEISCKQNRCVSSYYQCDGHNNCGNNFDEFGCIEAKQTSNFAIVGGLMGALVALLLLCYCWRCCCGKSNKRKEYIQMSKDDTDSAKMKPQNSNVEPSAPISPYNVNYGSTTSHTNVRYPFNPNYPYFIDGANAPPYPVSFRRPQSSGIPDHYSHYPPPPPPPYSPSNEAENVDNIDSNFKSEATQKT